MLKSKTMAGKISEKKILNLVFASCIAMIIVLSSCKNEPSKLKGIHPKAQPGNVQNAEWKKAAGENINFRYPSNWVLKKKDFPGRGKMFGLNRKTNGDLDDFFVFEIYEMQTMGRPFREFKFGAVDLIDKRFQGKATVRNTEDFKFRNIDARKYEADMPGENGLISFDVYAINGGSRYYALFHVRLEQTDSIVKSIMNSIAFTR
jgi:hypothetical protein